ncbi:MAG TPA: sigma-70 family RNA polymerase sigma factor [Phycisphaerales bacterium]|nr:sigma-70 family RNA polymerase sigma factor [Phycisphaerales bacterium]
MAEETNQSSPEPLPTPLARAGRGMAGSALLPQVYEQLRKLAAQRLASQPVGQTLQPTALVHEAFMRLTANGDPGWESTGHFYGAAAIAMRYVLVDHARARLSQKRGGGRARVDLETADVSFDSASEDIIALDELLTRLEQHHPRQSELLSLKFFAGLTDGQIANVLNVSEKTVQRDFRFARAWLLAQWQGGEAGNDGGRVQRDERNPN